MGQPVLKDAGAGAAVVALPGKPSEVVPLPVGPAKPFLAKLAPLARGALVNLLPPLITVALILLFWQLAAHGPQSSLPPPTKIWEEAKDLIVQPFYWAGSQDIGLGWRILVSLQRVAIGFSLAAVVGILLVLMGMVKPFRTKEGEWRRWPVWLRTSAYGLGAFTIGAALLGYIGLATFVSLQVVVTGTILSRKESI